MFLVIVATAVVLISGQAGAAEFVSWGPKAYTVMTVAEKTGVNTAHARATLAYDAKTIDAICMKVDGSTKPDECYVKSHPFAPGKEVRRTITANCDTGKFLPPVGGKVTFAGLDEKKASEYNYRLVRKGKLLGYPQHDMALSTYRALCPASVRLPDEKPMRRQ